MGKKAKGAGGARGKVRHAAEVRDRELEFADEEQGYGIITAVLGTKRFSVRDIGGCTRTGHARGGLRRRDRICMGDVVLFSEREFERDKSKVDILFLYSAKEARRLTEYGELPSGFCGQTDVATNEEEEEDDVVFDEGDIDNI
jgi:initiation factor 1A